jgi:hypothetical protein
MFSTQAISRSALALLFSLLAFSTQAKTLSDNTIRAFIDSMRDAQTLQEEYEGTDQWPDMTNEDMESMPDMSRLFSEGVEKMKDYPAYDQFENMVEKHGFDSPEDWALVGDRVFQAMMAIEMKGKNPNMGQDMSDAMANIDNNPDMSAEQKAQMKAMMSGVMGMVKSATNASPADIKAVRPHMDALRAVMGDTEE